MKTIELTDEEQENLIAIVGSHIYEGRYPPCDNDYYMKIYIKLGGKKEDFNKYF